LKITCSDALACLKHVTEFTWNHGLSDDLTINLWSCTEDCVRENVSSEQLCSRLQCANRMQKHCFQMAPILDTVTDCEHMKCSPCKVCRQFCCNGNTFETPTLLEQFPTSTF
jgi:hypothetical protein